MMKMAVLLLVLSTVAAAPGIAEKPAADTVPDVRLAQKVTIECVNVRLHTALERISAQTGVDIRCGRSAKDWEVRDLPILVCVRDMPLGVLLRTIADVMHLGLTVRDVEGVKYYRIWRDAALEKELADYEQRGKEAAQAIRTYDWDLYSKAKDVPDSKLPEFNRAIIKALSGVMSALDTETKERVFSDGLVALCASEMTGEAKENAASAFRECYESNQRYAREHEQPGSDLSFEAALAGSSLVFKSERPSVYDRVALCIELWLGGDGYRSLDIKDFGMLPGDLERRGFPPRPEMPKPPGSAGLTARYQALDPYNPYKDDPTPLLKTKVKLEAPKDKKVPTYADALAALSAASGYSVVAEDFTSHRGFSVQTSTDTFKTIFKKEVAVREILALPFEMRWYLDERNKAILAVEDDWILRIKNMVPESLITSITTTLRTDGLDLDDLDSIAGLTTGQISDWFASTELSDLGRKGNRLHHPGSLWPLYFALNASDRKLAKSDLGLSLAKFDPEWVRKYLREAGSSDMQLVLDGCVRKPGSDDNDAQALTAPEVFQSLVMRVKKMEIESAPGRWVYFLEIEDSRDGNVVRKSDQLPFLPVYSPDRWAEIQKEKQKTPVNLDKPGQAANERQ